MLTRALTGLAFLLGGCTIHVVEQPATPVAAGPAPTAVVANAPAPRPEPVRVSHVPAHERPAAQQPTPVAQQPAPPRNTPPARSDMDAVRPAKQPPQPSQPQARRPLRTPFRDVGPSALPSKLTTAEPRERHKVKKDGT
jgi:hypothetical protein